MKKMLLLFCMCFVKNGYAQNFIKIDDGFLGVPSTSALSRLSLNGSSSYKLTVDEWLLILNKSDKNVLIPTDFKEPKTKYKKILSEASEQQNSELALRQILLDDKVFPNRTIEFDSRGLFKSISLHNPDFRKKDILFKGIANTFEDIYGKPEQVQNESLFAFVWKGNYFQLILMQSSTGETIVLYEVKDM